MAKVKCEEIKLPKPGKCKAIAGNPKGLIFMTTPLEDLTPELKAQLAHLMEQGYTPVFPGDMDEILIHSTNPVPKTLRAIFPKIKQVTSLDLPEPKSKYHK